MAKSVSKTSYEFKSYNLATKKLSYYKCPFTLSADCAIGTSEPASVVLLLSVMCQHPSEGELKTKTPIKTYNELEYTYFKSCEIKVYDNPNYEGTPIRRVSPSASPRVAMHTAKASYDILWASTSLRLPRELTDREYYIRYTFRYESSALSSTVTSNVELTDSVTVPARTVTELVKHANHPVDDSRVTGTGTQYPQIGAVVSPEIAIDTTGEYVSTGWYYDAECTQPIPDAGVTVPIGPTLDLYAGWKKAGPSPKIKIDGEWTEGELRAKVEGQWVNASALYVKVGGEWIEIS